MSRARRWSAAGAALLAGWAAAAAADSSHIEIVRAFREARQRGDLAAARAFLAPDARIWFDMEEREGPGKPWTLEVDDWDRWDQFFRSKTEYSDWTESGDRVRAVGRESNDFYRLADWTPRPLAFSWWFDATGRISGFLFHAVKDAPSDTSRFEQFKLWAARTHGEELADLMPKGRIDPAGDRPARFRTLLLEWRKAAGLPPVQIPETTPRRNPG